MKTLVLFVFHQYNERVEHFIKNAIFYDEDIDFLVISNDKNNVFELPDYVNVTKMFRDNVGYDNGGWSDALLNDQLYLKYDSFIFVNSSVIGPFLPSYYKEKWTTVYLDGLKDNVKLFGSTINIERDPLHKSHVQSYIFSMNRETLEYLIQCEIFSTTNYAKTFDEAIWLKEVGMSRKIIENGWNIGCLLELYKDIDFTFTTIPLENCSIEIRGDVMYPEFDNKLWNRFQLVFIKGNR